MHWNVAMIFWVVVGVCNLGNAAIVVETELTDAERFVELIRRRDIERIEMLPLAGSERAADRKIYFAWGYLEEQWTNYQYAAALTPINALRAAGWGVAVDGWTTEEEARQYIADAANVAMYWSSHGTAEGELTVWYQSGVYDYFSPTKITEASTNLRFALLCACYSLQQGEEFQRRMNGATIYSFHGTVTVENCALQLKHNFIRLFNHHF